MWHDADKIVVGWEEWCSLPELGLPAIKAKVDTGARTSALHAYKVVNFFEAGEEYVRFYIHPVQRTKAYVKSCIARVTDRRYVSDSGGHREKRYVITTPLLIDGKMWDIEVTLANRDTMAFRMLLGREAMRGRLLVDPIKSCCQGKVPLKQLKKYYHAE